MLRRNENVEDDDVAEEDRSQDRDPQFVRACAIEMHLDVSQEPFYATIFRKKTRPRRACTFCASLRSRNAHGHVARTSLRENC